MKDKNLENQSLAVDSSATSTTDPAAAPESDHYTAQDTPDDVIERARRLHKRIPARPRGRPAKRSRASVSATAPAAAKAPEPVFQFNQQLTEDMMRAALGFCTLLFSQVGHQFVVPEQDVIEKHWQEHQHFLNHYLGPKVGEKAYAIPVAAIWLQILMLNLKIYVENRRLKRGERSGPGAAESGPARPDNYPHGPAGGGEDSSGFISRILGKSPSGD